MLNLSRLPKGRLDNGPHGLVKKRKNLERITYRVQSKNKDQVRHYYYRLVKRMNILLGPGLPLDAKNSKDTNAAMLHWQYFYLWSLLEKFSCKATKLHLKRHRFKVFVEALEYQLQKDRKKNVKRRSPNRENICDSAPSTLLNQSKHAGNDARAVKLVLVDSQNIQKAGDTKGSSARRNRNVRVCRKGETSPTKVSKQRRKPDGLFKSSNVTASRASFGTATKELDIKVDQRFANGVTLSPGEWTDSLTNISIGDLLQEASDNVDRNCDELHVPASSQCLEHIPLHQERMGFQFGMASSQSSIWDGEEACDAFSFMMKRSTPDERHPLSSNPASSATCEGNAQAKSMRELETLREDAEEIDPMDECPPETEELVGSGKEFGGLADIYWPDSLGPLDLDVPSCKYYCEELILSDKTWWCEPSCCKQP
ncbi:TSL-kinase interacting protein 1-like protein [Drosera capensis]